MATQTRKPVTKENVEKFLKRILGDKPFEQSSFDSFVNKAVEGQLDPELNELQASLFKNSDTGKYSIASIVHYTVLIAKAQETKKFNGYKVVIHTAKDANGKTIVTGGEINVYRKDRTMPFHTNATYDLIVKKNYDGQPNSMWKNNAEFMTRKTLIRIGMTCAFPEILGMFADEDFEAVDHHEEHPTPPAAPTTPKAPTDKIADVMSELKDDKKETEQTTSASATAPTQSQDNAPADGVKRATEKQIKLLENMMKQNKTDPEKLFSHLLEKYEVPSIEELTTKTASDLIGDFGKPDFVASVREDLSDNQP